MLLIIMDYNTILSDLFKYKNKYFKVQIYTVLSIIISMIHVYDYQKYHIWSLWGGGGYRELGHYLSKKLMML